MGNPTLDLIAFFKLTAPREDLICKSESPIESKFFRYLRDELSPATKMEMQKWFRTPSGNFRTDFHLTTAAGRTMVIELDGKQWHDAVKDELRDLAIISTGKVDCIYRVKGKDIIYNSDDVFHILDTSEPEIFAPRRKAIIERMGTEEGLREDKKSRIDNYTLLSRFYFDWINPYPEYEDYDYDADDAPVLRPAEDRRKDSAIKSPTIIKRITKEVA